MRWETFKAQISFIDPFGETSFFLCQRTCLCFLFICINDCNSVWQSVSNTNHFGDYAESCLRWPWFVPVLFPQNRRPILIKTKFERNLVGEHTNSTALIQWDKTSPKSLHLSVAQPTKPIKSNPACLPLSSNDLYPPFKQFSFALGAWTWKWRVAGQMHVSKNLAASYLFMHRTPCFFKFISAYSHPLLFWECWSQEPSSAWLQKDRRRIRKKCSMNKEEVVSQL